MSLNGSTPMPTGNISFFGGDGCRDSGDGDDSLLFLQIVTQGIILVGLSHCLHFFLKRLGQPSAISQMLAGLIMGPSLFANTQQLSSLVFPADRNRDYLSTVANMGRQVFMFLIGLELDLPYLIRTGRKASVMALGGAAVSAAVAGLLSPLLYWLFNIYGSFLAFALVLMAIYCSTASPILVRMCTELKMTNSEVGRLAVSAAIITDMACLMLVAAASTVASIDGATVVERMIRVIFALVVMSTSIGIVRPFVRWLNYRNRLRRHIKITEVLAVLVFVTLTSFITEVIGYSSMMTCFLIGVLFPREGATARTLVDRLSYVVHNVVLPIYFGYNAMQVDLNYVHGKSAWGSAIVVVTGTLAKLTGTITATRYLNIPHFEGLVLGFLLNVKGHVDIIIITMAWKHNLLPIEASMALLSTVVVNALIAGPAVAAVVRNERKALKYRAMGLEWQNPEGELRVLTCVHGPRELPTILNLIEVSSGTEKTPIAAYVMQLVELTMKTTTAMLYHQQEDHSIDDEDYGADEARQINVAVDAFTHETGITIRQVTAVSSFTTMYEDVCNGAEDVRASLVVLPFHKFQRVDGKMVGSKPGIRVMNAKVLDHAPCTVGILVDRGFGGATQVSASQSAHQVAAIFFGGPDDREALAYGSRLAMHPMVSLTLVRFLPASKDSYDASVEMQASKDEEVLMAITNHDKESEADEAFLSDFYNRFITSGMVTYEERVVENSAGTVAAVREMDGVYSLFLVGRNRSSISPLIMGLNEWEESPELGPIGDLLASSDFTVHGSVLVLQQHKLNKPTEDLSQDEEFIAL